MRSRSFNGVALVVVGVAVVAVSAATAFAARSAASPFEIVATDRYEAIVPECPDCWPFGAPVQTFTSGAPFCESGTVVDLEWSGPHGERFRRYTCTDGSGDLTLTEPGAPGHGEWTIVEGSGRYAGLRGKGSWREEDSQDPAVVVIRTTLQGFADYDAAAPSLAFTSTSATKLRDGAPGAYLIRVVLSLRDDVERNTVAYRLRAVEGPEHPGDRRRAQLAVDEGRSASGSVSTTLRVYPSSKRVRNVVLVLSASDPVGNEVSVVRLLKLPRS